MDNSSVNSDIPDLLEFLRPPVKKIHRSHTVYRNDQIYEYLGHVQNKCSSREVYSGGGESTSRSLQLKKTVERSVNQRSSKVKFSSAIENPTVELNYNSQSSTYRRKPLIQVTVIPRVTQNQTQNVFRNKKKAKYKEKLQNSASNQDNTITTKNVYLVITGRKREKIYEIKTTKSASLVVNRTGIFPNDVDTYDVIHPKLRMDKKKKKDKDKSATKDKKSNKKEDENRSVVINDEKVRECNRIQNDIVEDNGHHLSRVRITGRLGLTADDKYVLKCAATVDNQPIAAEFTEVMCNILPENNRLGHKTPNIECINKVTKEEGKKCIPTQTNKSQGTQVNVSLFVPKTFESGISKDQITQCNCVFDDKTVTCNKISKDDPINPLVIISVIPNTDEPEHNNINRNVNHHVQLASPQVMSKKIASSVNKNPRSRPVSPRKFNANDNTQISPNKKMKTPRRDNSPSPSRPTSSETYFRNQNKGQRKDNSLKSKKELSPLRQASYLNKNKPKTAHDKGMQYINDDKNVKHNTMDHKGTSTNRSESHFKSDRRNNNGEEINKVQRKITPGNINRRTLSPETNRKITPENMNRITLSPETNRKITPENMNRRTLSPETKRTVFRDKNINGQGSLSNKNNNINQHQQSTTIPSLVYSSTKNTNNNNTAPEKKIANSKNKTLKTQGLHFESQKHSKEQEKLNASVAKTFKTPDTLNTGANKSKSIKNTQATNTDHQLAKKELVEKYADKVAAQMSLMQNRRCNPANNVSNVKIDIDSDKEHYDLLFQQDCGTTDVHVRKTLKNRSCQGQFCVEDNDIPSMENFLLYQGECNQQSNSQAFVCDTRTFASFVKDSVELCHRREDAHPNNVVTQTSNVCTMKADTSLFAPVKHFIGDDCSLIDPFQRDEEIRGLLGVQNTRTNPSKVNQLSVCEKGNQVSCHKYQRMTDECDFNFLEELINFTTYRMSQGSHEKPQNHRKIFSAPVSENKVSSGNNSTSFYQHSTTQYKRSKLMSNSIVLSRRDYERVKQSIQESLSYKRSNEKRRARIIKNIILKTYSLCSKNRIKPSLCDKEIQTDVIDLNTKNIQATNSMKQNKDDPINSYSKNRLKSFISPSKINVQVLFNAKENKRLRKKQLSRNDDNISNKVINPLENHVRQTKSSVEIHYASVALTKQVTFSSTNCEGGPPRLNQSSLIPNIPEDLLEERRKYSVHTIFKGHKKSVTPNLGTSAYSLCPEGGSEHSFSKSQLPYNNEKQRKPFLRRLMSCLVMKATRTSNFKVDAVARGHSVMNSSIDSYHINTSLGGIDMTSSLYDTSASFYSNHSILPINSKMKRGFFSSVRGFLTNNKI